MLDFCSRTKPAHQNDSHNEKEIFFCSKKSILIEQLPVEETFFCSIFFCPLEIAEIAKLEIST